MKPRIKVGVAICRCDPAGHLVVKPREFVRFERRTASYPWLDHPSSRCRNWFPWRLDRTVTWSREVIVTLETTVHHSTSAPPKSHFEKTAPCFANYPPRTTTATPTDPTHPHQTNNKRCHVRRDVDVDTRKRLPVTAARLRGSQPTTSMPGPGPIMHEYAMVVSFFESGPDGAMHEICTGETGGVTFAVLTSRSLSKCIYSSLVVRWWRHVR